MRFVYAWQKKTGRRSIAQSAESTLLENTQTFICSFSPGVAPDSLICRIQNKYFAIIEKENKKIEKKIQNP